MVGSSFCNPNVEPGSPTLVSPVRRPCWPVMNEANMMIKDFSGKEGRLFYFDSATPLLSSDGKPNVEVFLKDQLHLNDKGYEVWTKLIRPIINEALEAAGKKR